MFFPRRLRILSILLLAALLVGPTLATVRAGESRIVETTQFDCSTVTEIPSVECQALVALYDSTDGANWYTNTGWVQSDTPCSWYGVTCSTGHVSHLQLDFNYLLGPVPSELGNLTELVSLVLHGNGLTGVIPIALENLIHVLDCCVLRL